MKKCQRCKRQASSFAFQDGQPVYACTHHRSLIKRDMVVDWHRLPMVKKEVGE